MVTALEKAQTDYVLFAPCDSPLLSPHLAERLFNCLIESHADISVADDGFRIHPVFSLFKRDVLTELKAFLKTGERGIHRFLVQQSFYATADFSESKETFSNVNTLEDLLIISQQLSQN
jgi:molybdopterin-guanine dinucleotide biosynthesis protein A